MRRASSQSATFAGSLAAEVTASGTWVADFTGLVLLDGCGQGGGGGGGARPAIANSTATGGGGGGGGGPAMRDQRIAAVVAGTTYTITIGNDANTAGAGASADGTSCGQATSGADTVFTDGAALTETWQGGQAARGGRYSAALEDLRAWGGIELAGADLGSSADGNFIPYYLLIPLLRMGGFGGRCGNTTAQAGTQGSSSVASTRTNRATAGAAGTNATGIAGSGGGSGATGPFGGIGGAGGAGGDGHATDGVAGDNGADAAATSYGAGGGGGGGGGNAATTSGNGGNGGKGGPGILRIYRLR